MNHRSFTAAVYHYLLNHPKTPEAVREWVLTEPDIEQRVLYFARSIAEDMGVLFRTKNALHRELIRLALARVNWRRVARALFRRFTLPIILASTDRRCTDRLTWPPDAWKGNVN